MKTNQQWTDIWNKKHCYYTVNSMFHTKNGSDYRNTMMGIWLEYILGQAKCYYYMGKPMMTDTQYDKFESFLKKLKPDSKLLTKVG